MKRVLLLLMVIVGCVSCEGPSMRSAESANRAVSVKVVTEFDGIRLYRVDAGDAHVYVAVSRSELRASWDELVGKTVVRRESQTLR